MPTLVTGAAGFLGSYLMAAIGQAAIGIDVEDAGPEARVIAPGAMLLRASITDRAQVQAIIREHGVDTIIHTASRVGLEPSLDDPVSFYETNVMGLVQLCEAARLAGARHLVLISSNAAYHGPTGDRLVETDPVFSIHAGNPAAHYGTTKMMQEAVALSYARFHGIDATILRVTALYGYGMRAPLYIKPMVEDAVAGRPTRFATGGPMKRDYTYISDVADAVLRATRRPGTRVLNVSAGRTHSAAEVAALVRRVIPGADIEIGDGLTAVEAENLRMRAPLDSGAAVAVLGWRSAWSLEAGIADYATRLKAAA